MSKLPPVIRRLSLTLFFVVAISACAGGSRVSIDAGDSSLSRDQVVTLAAAFQGNADTPAVQGDLLRSVSTAYLRSAAFLDYFESVGIEIPDGLRGSIQDDVTRQMTDGEFSFLEFDSPEFEALVEINLVQQLIGLERLGSLEPSVDLEFHGQAAILSEFADDFEVESRIGEWNDDTFTVTANDLNLSVTQPGASLTEVQLVGIANVLAGSDDASIRRLATMHIRSNALLSARADDVQLIDAKAALGDEMGALLQSGEIAGLTNVEFFALRNLILADRLLGGDAASDANALTDGFLLDPAGPDNLDVIDSIRSEVATFTNGVFVSDELGEWNPVTLTVDAN